jgi:hypothetical protein
MFNKDSCRMCGSCLTTAAHCKICRESVSWICQNCNKIEEVKHSDYYCTIWMSRRLELGLEDSNAFEMIINR